MAGRRTKLTDPVQKQIVQLLSKGVTIADACAHVGIHVATFYNWMQRGEAGEPPFLEFFEATNRAHNAAKVVAIETIRTAMEPYTQKATATKTYTEVRVLKDKGGNVLIDDDGNPKTYEYKEVTETRTTTLMQGDWRAALEFLKRKYPDEWTDRIKIENWYTQAVADIRAGKITPDMLPELERAFDRVTAVQLFAEAGIDVTLAE